MGLYKAVINLKSLSAIAEDDCNNSFYFRIEAGDDTVPDTDSLHTRLTAFYNTVPGGATKALRQFIGSQITRAANACSILYYHTADFSPPIVSWGSPVRTKSFTLGAADAGSNLPSEVCVVNSFHADLTDIPETEANPAPPPAFTRPAAQRRGRVYIGPLRGAVGVTGGTGEVTIDPVYRTAIQKASVDLEAANDDLVWVVASRTAGDSFPVVGGYVDNAFDTQRRRGHEASARDIWP